MWNFVLGVLSNWVADALATALAGGTVLAWMMRRHPSWIPTVCWGLGGAVVILIGAGALRVVAIPIPKPVELTTTDNIEPNIRRWVDTFHLAVQKLPDAQDRFFSYSITNLQRRSTVVTRSRALDRYLVFDAGVGLGADDARRFAQLRTKQSNITVNDLISAMAQFKIGFINIVRPLTAFTLEKTVPITPELNESSFIQDINDMDSAQVLALATIARELEEYAPDH